MLRSELGDTPADEADAQEPCTDCWRVSSGSAAVLGLRSLRMDAAPTTAYLMLGGRCRRNCVFCTQAHSSHANQAALSRVLWPEFAADDVAAGIDRAHQAGTIRRVCLQVTDSPEHVQEAAAALQRLRARSSAPVCCSINPRDVDEVGSLLAVGADRVTIALDAASEEVFRRTKSGSWARTWELLTGSAQRYPGRISTHVIVGLGETERDLAECLQRLHDLGIGIGLFSFTPVAGTAWSDHSAPTLDHYRRMQAARWLIVHNLARAEAFVYDDAGRLLDYGVPREQLHAALADGSAWRTSGCPDCNRPYYNERPGGPMYNYARPLTADEAAREWAQFVQELGSPEAHH